MKITIYKVANDMILRVLVINIEFPDIILFNNNKNVYAEIESLAVEYYDSFNKITFI